MIIEENQPCINQFQTILNLNMKSWYSHAYRDTHEGIFLWWYYYNDTLSSLLYGPSKCYSHHHIKKRVSLPVPRPASELPFLPLTILTLKYISRTNLDQTKTKLLYLGLFIDFHYKILSLPLLFSCRVSKYLWVCVWMCGCLSDV